MTYREFFNSATGHSPYPFQVRFAEAEELPHLLRAPTGAGKTATAILGWLWRRKKNPNTPRRLVYCLPMRVLVEQSQREAEGWIKNLGLDIPVHVLMGGVDLDDWHLHPEKPAVLIGTQDMLLSRALNRGYAESRFHWPVDFGLLNNDCLWVFDEPQLMANGVSTSAQLAAFRKQFATLGDCPSVWMSATLEPGWLDTIDFRGQFPDRRLELEDEDYDPKLPLHKRMTATKTLHALGATSTKDMKDVATKVLRKHDPGTQTLVVVNTVDRAKALYDELLKLRKKSESPKLLLVHSRFRPAERERLNDELQAKGDAVKDRIIIATQVVEAGVDISSRTLITELAPWASIVQRIGRCNRTGDDGPGQVFWINLDDKTQRPYEKDDLDTCKQYLDDLENRGVSPRELSEYTFEGKLIVLPFEHKHVLRRRDLLDLFDTSPDLSGNDIDISRFVRSDDPDTDVQVFWRHFADEPGEQSSPHRRELCNVPVGQARKFIEAIKHKAYTWDHLEDEWVPLDEKQVRPGLMILLPTAAGGYSTTLGWTGSKDNAVVALAPSNVPEEGAGSDRLSSLPLPKPLTLAEHTRNVVTELGEILKTLTLPNFVDTLTNAARWHDIGKAHAAFQDGMRSANAALTPDQQWAKSGKNGKLTYCRKHFRHELASALAILQSHPEWPFLVAYLAASHHGKCRLSIRSLPGEQPPEDPEQMFALGVHHHDKLPALEFDGVSCPALELDLTPMRLGGETSWTAKALQLLAELGPFKLAYLEAIIRAADVRASQKEAGHE